MERIEIGLSQGWSRGLVVAFEDAASSAVLNLENFTHVKQVHGKEIASASDVKSGVTVADGIWAQGEAARSMKPLLVKSADCIPLIYVDHRNEAIAAVHAGWRGLAQGIHRVPFESKGFDPKTTWVWMGPSLNGLSFEVQADMWTQFGRDADNPSFFLPAPPKEKTMPEKRHFFAWNYVRAEFGRLAVELVYNVEVDTYQNSAFHSYRRLKSQGKTIPGVGNVSWIGFRS